MIVYKVVRKQGDDWISAAVTEPEVQLKYSIGKVTKAKPGSIGVFVFDTLFAARSWWGWVNTSKTIFECEGPEEVMHPKRIRNYTRVGLLLRRLTGHKISWSRRLRWIEGKLAHLMDMSVPQGTVTVKWVRPVREIS